MRRISVLAFSLLVGVLAPACGGKEGGSSGGSGISGVWTIDVSKSMSAFLESEMGKKSLEGVKGDELATRKKQMTMIYDQLKAALSIKADGTFSGEFTGLGEAAQTRTGTWVEKGGAYVLTTKLKDGQPAEGDDTKSVTGTLRDGALVLQPADGPPVALVRK